MFVSKTSLSLKNIKILRPKVTKILSFMNIHQEAYINLSLSPEIDFTDIFLNLFRENKMRSFFWQMAFGKQRTNLAKSAPI